MIRRNVANQKVGAALINPTTAQGQPGLAPLVWVSVDGGAQYLSAGSVSDKGYGQYVVNLTAADTNGNSVSVLVAAPGAVPVEKTLLPFELSDLGLATVATTGTYNSLTGKPFTATLFAGQPGALQPLYVFGPSFVESWQVRMLGTERFLSYLGELGHVFQFRHSSGQVWVEVAYYHQDAGLGPHVLSAWDPDGLQVDACYSVTDSSATEHTGMWGEAAGLDVAGGLVTGEPGTTGGSGSTAYTLSSLVAWLKANASLPA